MDVSDLKAGPLAVQAAGAEGRKTTLMVELTERIGLVDNLG